MYLFPPPPPPKRKKFFALPVFPISPGYNSRPKILGVKQGALWSMWKW